MNEDTDLVEEMLVKAADADPGRLVLPPATRAVVDRVVAENKSARSLARKGLIPTLKILIAGPPGTGKSMTARTIAAELGRDLYELRNELVVNSLLGMTARNLHNVFKHLNGLEAVVLIDEMDVLGRSRGVADDHVEMLRVVTAMLGMVERYRGPSVIVCTTNVADAIDDAMWRRFDEVLNYSLPDGPTREALFGIYSESDIKDADFAKSTKGMSHADIRQICERARRTAVLARRKLRADDIAESIKYQIPKSRKAASRGGGN